MTPTMIKPITSKPGTSKPATSMLTKQRSVILSEARNPRTSLLPLLVLLIIATAQAQPAAKSKSSGTSAYILTQQFIAAAPHRWIGSPDHAKAEAFIQNHFKPEAAKGNFEADTFTATTPVGALKMTNFIVKYPGKQRNNQKADGIIVIASHYETNYPLRDIDFVGANDGAATSALLMQLGVYLRANPPEGFSVWLVFDDGEEAIANPPYQGSQWSSSNSLYGTRHLAAKWSQNGTIAKIKAFLVADMIGDKDLNIDRDQNSTPWLLDLLAVAAKNTGHSAYVFKNVTAVEDDHLPFKQRGVPVLDLIDLDYGAPTAERPEGGFHHTIKDTLDKVSPRSLQISADLFLEVIRLINQRPN